MNINLKQFKKSSEWRSNLSGMFKSDNCIPYSDQEIRYIVELGIARGYRTLNDIPKEDIKKWINK